MEVTNYLLTGMILQVPLISLEMLTLFKMIWRVKKPLGDEERDFHAALRKARFLMLILKMKLNLCPLMESFKDLYTCEAEVFSSCSIMNKWVSGIPRSKCFPMQIGDEINKGEQPVKCKLSIQLFFEFVIEANFYGFWFLASSSLWQRGHCWQDERFSKTVALLIHSNLWNLGHAKFACSGWNVLPCLKLTACPWKLMVLGDYTVLFGVNCPFSRAYC